MIRSSWIRLFPNQSLRINIHFQLFLPREVWFLPDRDCILKLLFYESWQTQVENMMNWIIHLMDCEYQRTFNTQVLPFCFCIDKYCCNYFMSTLEKCCIFLFHPSQHPLPKGVLLVIQFSNLLGSSEFKEWFQICLSF